MQQAAPAAQAEPRWHAALAVGVAIVLYVTLPQKLIVGPLWLMPLLVSVILIPLIAISPRRHHESRLHRSMSIFTVVLLNAFNIGTVVTLFLQLISVHHRKPIGGEELLLAAVEIWLTNVIVYALWFWEIDGHGPDIRPRVEIAKEIRRADFLFPQMALSPELREHYPWRPKFLDYVFLSFTNATAFSPTDTFPLTRFAKVLMMAEGLTSLITIAVIAGRAINILGS